MKFSELPVGVEFVFEGERYLKVSPLMAHHAVTGASRLVHRSAAVATVGSEASPGARQALPETVASLRVISALDELCLEVAKTAKEPGVDGRTLAARLEDWRQKFLRSVGLAE